MHCLERLRVPAFHYVLQLLLWHFGHALHRVTSNERSSRHGTNCASISDKRLEMKAAVFSHSDCSR